MNVEDTSLIKREEKPHGNIYIRASSRNMGCIDVIFRAKFLLSDVAELTGRNDNLGSELEGFNDSTLNHHYRC